MADSNVTRGRTGFTILGPGEAGKPSGIIFRGSDGFDRGLWIDTSGKLRVADVADIEASAFDPDSTGTVVGTQS